MDLPSTLTRPAFLAGSRLHDKRPVKTLLVTDMSALFPGPGINHLIAFAGQGKRRQKHGQFADGHVSYIKIYWNSNLDITQTLHDPPAGYDYKKGGDCQLTQPSFPPFQRRSWDGFGGLRLGGGFFIMRDSCTT